MADNDRAMYFAHNTGIEAQAVAGRVLYGVENVGFEVVPVSARALYGVENVGVSEPGVLARALYGAWAVSENTGEGDGLEVLLVAANILTVEHVLAGK